MYSKKEFEREILKNELIYCDTCIAMSKGFENFIDNFASILKKHKRKIIIIQEVYQELLHNAFIYNIDVKENYASRAIDLINSNIEIFEVESGNKTEKQAFADPKLLARLIENKAYYSQLLITNDRNLSLDSKKFNSFESINGKPIKVCYVNKYGDINKFECCKAKELEQEGEYFKTKNVVEIPAIGIIEEKLSNIDIDVKPTIKTVIIGVGTGFITYLIINNKEKIREFIGENISKIAEMVA